MYANRFISVLLCIAFYLFPLPSAYAEPDYTKNPVFLVHGHGYSTDYWSTLITTLVNSGYPPEYLEAIALVPNDGANIPAAEAQIAPAIETFLDSINTFLAANHPDIPLKTKVDLVSHSMGGLSTRWYAARVRPDRVHKWISLAGANHGTDALCPYPGGGSDDSCPAYAESETESFIQYQLNGAPYVADVDETPYGIGQDSPGVVSDPPDQNRKILYVTIRTSPDPWIDPEDSAILDGTGGVVITIPGDLPATMTSEGNLLMTNGVGHTAMVSNPDTIRLVKIILDEVHFLLTSTVTDELAADFGTNDLWHYDGTTWSKMTTWNPDDDMAGWFDGLAVDFGTNGLWNYDGLVWRKKTSWNPGSAGMTGWTGGLAVDFDGNGLWNYNVISWSKKTSWNPDDDMVSWDGGLAVDFGANGLWNYDGLVWSKKTSWNVGSGGMAGWAGGLAVDFDSNGLWNFNGSTWSKKTSWNPGSGGLCGWDGGLAVDFDGNGLWNYDGITWSKKTDWDPEGMSVLGNGLAVDFGANGVWYYDGSTWSKKTSWDAENLTDVDCN